MEKINVLAPEYYKDFECIGSKCELTCCGGWNITVDEDTYEKYRKIDEKSKKSKKLVFSPLSEKHIIRYKKTNNLNEYAKIQLIDNKCPFLDDEMLCNIYIKLGSNNMPYTCRTYPRNLNKINDSYEISLTISCPEAARKVLLNKNTMAFENIDITVDRADMNFINFSQNTDIHNFFWDIRIASITILQNRKFDLVQRLMLVGIMYKKIEKYISDNSYNGLSNTITNFVSSLDNISEHDFDNLKGNPYTQIDIYRYFFSLYQEKNNIFYDEYILPSLNFINTLSESNDLKRYHDAKNIFSKYTKGEFSYILENFLVNEYFRYIMLFGNFKSIEDGLIKLCSDYTFIQGISLAIIDKNSDLDIETLLKIIYTFGRYLLHNSNYNIDIKINVTSMNLCNLAGIYTLIF